MSSPTKALVTGSKGQLGTALCRVFDAVPVDVDELDITNPEAVSSFDTSNIKVIINAAAYTAVDHAEDDRDMALAVNSIGVKNLANLANSNNLPLVHYSTEYVFDGEKQGKYLEDDKPNPLSVYGESKAMGDENAKTAKKFYIIRTSWVIGEGHNFVKTMLNLARPHSELTVVNDQIGRPTFTPVLANATKHLLESGADFGEYNVTNSGEPVSWADFARTIFEYAGLNTAVKDVTSEEYFTDRPHAKRPKNSVLDLSKAETVGIELPDWRDSLRQYIKESL